jgi:hypothetical protein
MRYIVAILAAGLCPFATLHAQVALPASAYRGGMPPVIEQDAPAPDNNFNSAAFSRAYVRAGRPAIAVLWNRELSDMLEQSTAQVKREEHEVEEKSAFSQNPNFGREKFSQRESSVTTLGEVKSQQAARNSPAESVDLQMRTSFVNAIASRGVVLVDRNLVMRTLGLKKASPDSQRVEAEALSKHAQLLLEVLNTPDAGSSTGWATQFTIKRFSDGAILATGYVDGRQAAPSPKRFQADPNGGGFREVAAASTLLPADLGRLAAEQTLAQLGEALAR